MSADKSSHVAVGLPYRPLLLVALAMGLGILVDRLGGSFLAGGLTWWWAAGGVLLGVCFVLRHVGADRALCCMLLLMAMSLGGAWHHLQWNYLAADDLALFASNVSEPVCVEAVVTSRAKQSPAPPPNPLRALPIGPRWATTLRVTRLRDGTHWRHVRGHCRLRVAGKLTGVAVGDRVLVFAQFKRTRPAMNPGQYDWAQAERGVGRHCELFCAEPECVTIVESAASSPLSRWVGNAAARCGDQLARYVGAEESGLALAVLLGTRERLDHGEMKSFFRTGTVHLLVVSGLHIGMLALSVWMVFQVGALPRPWAVVLTAVLVVAYAIIAGGRPPVVRATILVLMGLVSLLVGRVPSSKVVLAAAAIVILAYNPSELFRGGTQLSFLCVAALSVFSFTKEKRPPVDPLTQIVRRREPWYLKLRRRLGEKYWGLLCTSFVIWIVTGPLVAYHFHIAAPVGIVITPLLWPLIAAALFTGLGICTVGWFFPPIAYLLGGVCAWCLGVTERIVSLADQIGLGHFYVPGPTVWWLLVFYGVMTLVAIVPRFQIGWKPLASLAAVWVAVGFAAAAIRTDVDRLRCTFLSVGHGTCVVLELPGGQTVLYDAGSLASPEGASQAIAGYLWSRGITHIDAVVLSHADVDHYNAMPGVLERFPVGVVYVSPLMFDPWATDGHLKAPEFLRSTLEQAGVPLREVWMNDRLRLASSEVEIEVLHPPRVGVAGRDNANSVLLSVRYAGHTILLPGDLESPGIEAVMAEHPTDCDILLAPHHGSSNSDPSGFAAWCTPNWVVVSSRQTSRNSLTNVSYRRVGANVIPTAEYGAVQFVLDSKGIEVSSYRNSGTSALPAFD